MLATYEYGIHTTTHPIAIANYAEQYKHILTPDKDAEYDQLIEIDLDTVYMLAQHRVCVVLVCVWLATATATCEWTIYSRPRPPYFQPWQYSS